MGKATMGSSTAIISPLLIFSFATRYLPLASWNLMEAFSLSTRQLLLVLKALSRKQFCEHDMFPWSLSPSLHTPWSLSLSLGSRRSLGAILDMNGIPGRWSSTNRIFSFLKPQCSVSSYFSFNIPGTTSFERFKNVANKQLFWSKHRFGKSTHFCSTLMKE